jgi:predicted amidophosphoribosyltransferase|tara:strand:- start:699 stop:851 length:153 start_codon:yes stop_codon:yes gene_type:complete
MVEKICKDCGKEFEQNKNSRYPRKYCDKCSAQRKKEYENIHLISAEDCEE